MIPVIQAETVPVDWIPEAIKALGHPIWVLILLFVVGLFWLLIIKERQITSYQQHTFELTRELDRYSTALTKLTTLLEVSLKIGGVDRNGKE
jgi:hypothetical protein